MITFSTVASIVGVFSALKDFLGKSEKERRTERHFRVGLTIAILAVISAVVYFFGFYNPNFTEDLDLWEWPLLVIGVLIGAFFAFGILFLLIFELLEFFFN